MEELYSSLPRSAILAILLKKSGSKADGSWHSFAEESELAVRGEMLFLRKVGKGRALMVQLMGTIEPEGEGSRIVLRMQLSAAIKAVLLFTAVFLILYPIIDLFLSAKRDPHDLIDGYWTSLLMIGCLSIPAIMHWALWDKQQVELTKSLEGFLDAQPNRA